MAEAFPGHRARPAVHRPHPVPPLAPPCPSGPPRGTKEAGYGVPAPAALVTGPDRLGMLVPAVPVVRGRLRARHAHDLRRTRLRPLRGPGVRLPRPLVLRVRPVAEGAV